MRVVWNMFLEIVRCRLRCFILLAVEIEVRLRRAGYVNPLILGLSWNQGTHGPRSRQFSQRKAKLETHPPHLSGTRRALQSSARFAKLCVFRDFS